MLKSENKKTALWLIVAVIAVCLLGVICFLIMPDKRISLRDAGVVMPENVKEISIANINFSCAYTDEKKIARILKYLNSIRLSPEIIKEENYYRPVVVPEMSGGRTPEAWRITLKTDDDTAEIYIVDDLSFGFVSVELPPNNPVIRYWSISQNKYDKFEPLIRSMIPDKLPQWGYGYEEWTEGLSMYEAYGLSLKVNDVHSTGCTLIFDQSARRVADFHGALQTDMSLELEVMNDGKWKKVKYAADNEWEEQTYSLKAFHETRLNADWTEIYGSLPAGHYRIHKVVTDYVDQTDHQEYDIYAEFDISE